MDIGDAVAVVVLLLFVGVLGFAAGTLSERGDAEQKRCDAVCAPRPAEHNGGKCFCLLEARP